MSGSSPVGSGSDPAAVDVFGDGDVCVLPERPAPRVRQVDRWFSGFRGPVRTMTWCYDRLVSTMQRERGAVPKTFVEMPASTYHPECTKFNGYEYNCASGYRFPAEMSPKGVQGLGEILTVLLEDPLAARRLMNGIVRDEKGVETMVENREAQILCGRFIAAFDKTKVPVLLEVQEEEPTPYVTKDGEWRKYVKVSALAIMEMADWKTVEALFEQVFGVPLGQYLAPANFVIRNKSMSAAEISRLLGFRKAALGDDHPRVEEEVKVEGVESVVAKQSGSKRKRSRGGSSGESASLKDDDGLDWGRRG